MSQTGDKPKRVVGKPFTKGDPRANAGGRPKQDPDLTEAFQAASPKALATLIACLDDPASRWADKNRASEVILNRAFGMPTQQVAHNVKHGFDWKAMLTAYEAVSTIGREVPIVIEATMQDPTDDQNGGRG